MKRLSIVSLSLLVLVGSAVGLYAAESETFRGAAARSGTYKRPLLIRWTLSQSEQRQLSSLSDQVAELGNINTTLKTYLEEVVSKVSSEDSTAIIEQERQRLENARMMQEFSKHRFVKALTEKHDMTLESAYEVYLKATSLEDLAERLENAVESPGYDVSNLVEVWKKSGHISEDINKVRAIMGLPALEWETPPPTSAKSTEKPGLSQGKSTKAVVKKEAS